jgi:hypothetical protein
LRPLILGYLVRDSPCAEVIVTVTRGARVLRLVLPSLLDSRDELPLAHPRRAGDAERLSDSLKIRQQHRC